MVSRILFFLLFITAASSAQMYSLQYIDTKTDASFRGLSVAGKNTVWVSGSKGWVGRTTDGGQNWTFKQVPGYEHCDFRTLYAFDMFNAVIANAGSPAYVLRTGDGGNTWKKVYENTDSAAFIDGIDFWKKLDNEHGIIHGDPIDGHMLLLYTKDGGHTWKERKKKQRPKLIDGEASFAASGTAIKCYGYGDIVVATGGKVSNLYVSRNCGKRWRKVSTPMLSGEASTGTYSFLLAGTHSWMIAGGDYKRDTVRTNNFFCTWDRGKTWQAPETTTRGYRECLIVIDGILDKPVRYIALGPSGIDMSTSYGRTWNSLSDEKGFHVMKPSWDNDLIFLAGANGKLAIMKTTRD